MEEAVYDIVYQLEDRHWWFRGRRAAIRALLARARLDPPLRVLDAGCGTGRNLQEYARLGSATGVDPSSRAVEFCRRRGLGDVEMGSVEELPFADGSFDLICATDVLEHVDDDRRGLRELHRVAAPRAVLLVTVPAYAFLWSESDVALQHRRRYAQRELITKAEDAGWSPEVVSHFNTLLLPAIAAARKLRRGKRRHRTELEATPSGLDGPLSVPMRLEAKLIARGARLPAGLSIGAVCRRL